MAVGTTINVKHNLKEYQAEGHAGHQAAGQEEEGRSDDKGVTGSEESDKHAPGKHQSHDSCKSCGSLADKCSCKDCECQVCSSKAGTAEQIEPAIKSATSSAILCGGGCIAAAQRAAAGGCPACECPAGGCPCTKCGCPICGPTQAASNPTPCCGGSEAAQRATAGHCPACGCPAGKCPCTGCKCPVCKSA